MLVGKQESMLVFWGKKKKKGPVQNIAVFGGNQWGSGTMWGNRRHHSL